MKALNIFSNCQKIKIVEQLIEYFSHIPSTHRAILLAGGLTFFLIIEHWRPFFQFDRDKWRHAMTNIFFTLTTIVVNFALAYLLVLSCDFVSKSEIGLLYLFDLPTWGAAIVGVLLLDFIAAYAAHWVQHKVWWMWEFHLVHHSDQEVDTTTANRHHPVESLFRFVFTLVAIYIIGAPIWMVMLYQSLSVIFTQFNHANILLPKWVDNLLRSVICMPDMHRVHHHYRQPYSDTNYGNIFSIWDRIFGTMVWVDNDKLKYGIDTHMSDNEAHDILTILKMPFRKYKGHIPYDNIEQL